MKNVFKKFTGKTNVEVLETDIQVTSLSNASVTVLTALLGEEQINELETDSIMNQLEDRYKELDKDEQDMYIEALRAMGVEIETISTLKITR